jgi:phosphoglycerate kinase
MDDMTVAPATMLAWTRALTNVDPAAPGLTLEAYLAGIPRLDSLADLPAGTPVLVRGDVDAKPGAKVGEGDQRLRSMLDTLDFGRQRGWKQIIFGHIGRKPEGSLKAVGKRFEELLQAPVEFVPDWLDENTNAIRDEAIEAVLRAGNGGFVLLENTRKYAIERALWKASADDLPGLAEPLARLANEFTRLADVYVNEAFSAGSLDASSTVLPAGMRRVALGRYAAGEFDGPMLRCLQTELVVFSGLKIDKLDDLQAMIDRGKIRLVFAAGSLAMALAKAAARLEGRDFSLGVAEDPAHHDKPYYIPPERIEQAREMLSGGRAKGIEFVLPVDFVLADGGVSEAIGPGRQQFDVGPATSALFERRIGEFIDRVRTNSRDRPAVAFHNGVFGMFEDERFAAGTKRFVPQLKRLKDAGVEVYVGGGEGGAALEKYGQPDWVTHCFTAGGTVLNALGSKPVPYLQALYRAANH